MIIVMKALATKAQIKKVLEKIKNAKLKPVLMQGIERNVIAIIGDERIFNEADFKVMHGVEKVMPVLKPYKLASREAHPENTIIPINGFKIGGDEIMVMAGPCAVENRKQIIDTAKKVKAAGAKMLRGGAFKPRTSPYSFQGLGEEGLKLMLEAKKQTGLAIVTEVMAIEHIDLIVKYADVLQIGTRNMQNFNLLREVGKTKKPVLLKRGMSATINEFLMSAEYVMSEGNPNVMMCERGIRTFETATRNTLDINAIPVLKELTHLPVIVDPSHATGKTKYVKPTSLASIAAGADGLIIEVHPNPEEAVSDGEQSLTPEIFEELMAALKPIAKAVGRKM